MRVEIDGSGRDHQSVCTYYHRLPFFIEINKDEDIYSHSQGQHKRNRKFKRKVNK